MPEDDRATLPPRSEPSPRALLAMRVSEVLDAVPGSLEVLANAGFTPLTQPAMRRMLAPTLTLEQAIRLRGLPDRRREALLRRLAALVPGEGGAPCR